MLQKENRLSKVRDFNLLFNYGRWLNTDNFSLKVLELNDCKENFPPKEDWNIFSQQLRFAFTVGVKLSKSAVKRNQLKRRMREVVRILVKEKQVKHGRYFLFVAKPGAITLGYDEIQRQIIYLFKKSNSVL